ncbi:MAG: hypothetical protein PUJ55_00530 [Clostridiales bacterium]|nr:hypothetical protein [Roseburia sp.]MDD7635403.1 hypothetical protein [Clostridiales bacterium]MDY4113159.1 hypothetical protein [Roseburia sp.]
MCIDEKRFEQAKNRVIGINRERQGIGTLSEKTVHAVLKNYYAPDTDMHEIPIAHFVADIYTGSEIIEIQTRSFNNMRRKLAAFLPEYPVTIVYPIPHVKWLSWIDEETGEMSPKRKSPKKGNPYQAFIELYKIRPFLTDENLKFRFDLIDMEEYRLLNGWSRDKKKGSDRFERIPTAFVEEVCVDCREDYMQFVPYDVPENFTAKDFARCAKIPVRLAQTVLLILTDLQIVERIGKEGRSYLYQIHENG